MSDRRLRQTSGVVELVGVRGQNGGEAARFLSELSAGWDFLHAYETMEPLLELTFDDGRNGAASDLEDVPIALYNCLAHYVEMPHVGWLHAQARVIRQQHADFDLQLAYEGSDGPLLVRFNDDSMLMAHLQFGEAPAQPPLTRWKAGVRAGLVQRDLEAIVGLAQLAELVEQMESDERAVAETLLTALARLVQTEEPPHGVVREVLGWLGRKVDVFVDEAVKTAGKATGLVGVGVAGYQLNRHMPELAKRIKEFIEMAG